MDPSIMKLLEDDEDEAMHSGMDVEAFQAALNRNIGDVSTSQFSGSDAVLSQGSNNTSSQSLSKWSTANHDRQTDSQKQGSKTAQQQEQPPSQVELKQHGSLAEQLQHVASQDINNPHLSQKQSQDEYHQAPAVQVSLHNSQAIGIQNSGKDPVLNNEVVKNHNPSSESQYAKLQQMSNQQATVSEQPSSQGNRSNSKQVPFGMLLSILLPQLAKDRAMQLQTSFAKLKKEEIPKDSFIRLMKGIVGDQMLRLALAKVQVQPQTRPIQASAGQQHPMRMGSGARQLNDPHALAEMHQRSMNTATDQSRMGSSAGQTMESNARKSLELDVKIESQGLQPSQLTSSSSNTVGQETERTSVHIQGLNKRQQQHPHFPSAYGNSGGNYNPFSGTSSSSTSSIKSQSHDSHMSQISHQSIGSNHHLGGSTHGLNVIGMSKLEQQNSFNDPKRLPGGSVSPAVNNTASQQTKNAWQPSTNKEQNLGLLSSVSYVKKEPSDLSSEQQNRHNLSKLHGYSSVNSAQLEQGGASQATVKDEFSRGLPASPSMPPTSTGLLPQSSASTSVMNQLDPGVSFNTGCTSAKQANFKDKFCPSFCFLAHHEFPSFSYRFEEMDLSDLDASSVTQIQAYREAHGLLNIASYIRNYHTGFPVESTDNMEPQPVAPAPAPAVSDAAPVVDSAALAVAPANPAAKPRQPPTKRANPGKRQQPGYLSYVGGKKNKQKTADVAHHEGRPTNQSIGAPSAAARTAVFPPPPPTGTSIVPPSDTTSRSGRLWEKGVDEEVVDVIKASKRFWDLSSLSRDDLKELSVILENGLKCAAMVQSLATLKTRQDKLLDELHASREETRKTHQELLASQDISASLRQELQAALDATESAQVALETARKKHALLTANLNELKTALELAQQEREEAKSKLQKAEEELHKAKEEAAEVREALVLTAEESFNNALDQMCFLNPGLELNTTGAHFKAYVDGDKLVPLSPCEDSTIPMDEDLPHGEEVTSTVQAQTPAP